MTRNVRTPSLRRMAGPLCAGLLLATPAAYAADATPPGMADPQQIFGQLRARNQTTLAAEIAGRIDRISARDGERFKKGQVLVVMDCRQLKAELAKSEAVLRAMEKRFAAEQRMLDLNSTGKLEVDLAETEVLKSRADVNAIRVNISKCVVKAPYSGRVVSWKAREYEFAPVGKGILEILDEKNLEIVFIVPSVYLAWLRPGHRFRFQVVETAKSYAAKVVQIGARVDPVSRSVTVIGVTEGQQGDLLPGMSGAVAIAKEAGQ